jgi:hypothetical protein
MRFGYPYYARNLTHLQRMFGLKDPSAGTLADIRSYNGHCAIECINP